MYPQPRETKLAAKKRGILNEVFRSGGCARFDLARRLNINATMVGAYVEEFLNAGLLVEGEPTQSKPGRAPVPLHPNADYGCFLGLDFEALRVRAVLCDFAGEVLRKEEVALRVGASREDVLRTIVSVAQRVAKTADRPLLSVGVASPGQVDCNAGRILHYRLIPDFDQVPIQDRFEAAFDVPVFIEDNIRAVAFAELLRGSGRGSNNFLCLAVRSGVGLGIIIDGKQYTGTNSMAGEVGYMVFPSSDGPKLITDLVSGTGFVADTRALLESRNSTASRQRLVDMGDDLSLTEIIAAAEAGDSLLHDQLELLGENLGMVAANLANLFAPEKIVLAGEVPSCCLLVRQTMERRFRELTLPQIAHRTYLDNGALGGFAGAMGTAWMGFSKIFPEDHKTLVREVMEKSAERRATERVANKTSKARKVAAEGV